VSSADDMHNGSVLPCLISKNCIHSYSTRWRWGSWPFSTITRKASAGKLMWQVCGRSVL